MSRYVQRLAVHVEYPVYFTRDVFAPQNPDLVSALSCQEPDRRHRALVAVDRSLAAAWPSLASDISRYAEHHRERIELVAEPLVLDGGEAAKNDPEVVSRLLHLFHDLGLDRHSFVVIVGGGALLDVVGYAAATAHRGLRVVRVPTTVLAQGDSGVGVKNGINAFGKKNFLGTFTAPFAVLNDERFLETLSRRDTLAGMAEAVKVALIRDADFFAWLVSNRPLLRQGALEPLTYLVRRSAELHLRHIATSGDPFEMGSARPLDFGHWAAHKLESLTRNRLRHGEAVAIGMAIDAVYSRLVGLCGADTVEAALGILEGLGFALWDEALDQTSLAGRREVLAGLGEFREHLGGELTVTLLEGIGQGVEVNEMREDVVVEAIERLRPR